MNTTTPTPEPRSRSSGQRRDPPVVPLNEAAALFVALAEGIRGSARDWPPSAVAKLERGLLDRFGSELGGEGPVRQLVALAKDAEAA